MVGVDWIGLAQDRDKWGLLVNVVKCRKLLSGHTTGGISSGAHLHIVN
jgi:hypothetical protein